MSSLTGRNDLPLLRADDRAEPILADAAQAVLGEVAERHATFGRMNLLAEAHCILCGVRFASPHDRVATAEAITTLATGASLSLSLQPREYALARARARLAMQSGHRNWTIYTDVGWRHYAAIAWLITTGASSRDYRLATK